MDVGRVQELITRRPMSLRIFVRLENKVNNFHVVILEIREKATQLIFLKTIREGRYIK